MAHLTRNTTTRRQFLKSAAAAAGGIAAAQVAGPGILKGFGAPVVPRPVRLLLWKHDHPPANAYFRRLFQEYKKVAPHVDLELVTAPTVEYYAKLPAALASGEPIDIFDMFEGFIPPLYKRGALDRVNYQVLGYKNAAEMEADHVPGTLQSLKYDGEFYGTIIEYNTFSMAINTALFRQIGLDPNRDAPKTWNELYEVGKKLVVMDGGRMVQAGFDSPFRASTTFNLILTLATIHQYGGNLLSPDLREPALMSDAVSRGFQHWVDIYHQQRLVLPTFGVKTPVAPNEDFALGTVAMYPFAGWGFGTLKDKPAENRVKVIPWPQGLPAKVTQAWMWALHVNAASRNKEEAWKFINWTMSGGQLENWLPNTGYIIPRKGWFTKPAARKFPFFHVFLEDMAISRTRQQSDKWAEITRVVNKVNDQLILDRAPLRGTLAAAQDEVGRILKG